MYYSQPALLLRQMDQFISYPKDLRDKIQLVIVDDGSPPGLCAQDYITQHHRSFFPRIMMIAHITTNRPWNTPGARNLAFSLETATTSTTQQQQQQQRRVLMIDLDLLVPEETARAVSKWKTRIITRATTPSENGGEDTVVVVLAHQFNRTQLDRRTFKIHPSAVFLDTQAYWATGGAEEDFSGQYGSEDVAFWYKFEQHRLHKRVVHSDIYLHQFDIEEPCNISTSSSTFRSQQRHPQQQQQQQACQRALQELPTFAKQKEINWARFLSKKESGCWSNQYLRFPWELVSWNE
jgi:hypothetical protein